ncbi:MAG: M48 family metalloprotease [Alphaproteobacteria bacterium]|nr:M48 family metalloprotease [Alphaproteobacteria bacterium]
MFKRIITLLLVVMGGVTPPAVHSDTAQWNHGHIYRDPQLENFLLKLLQPLYKEAGLNPALVQPRVIVNPAYNAFATLENLIVVHTGFFAQTATVEEMAGVLAHETGHQAGRHILRTFSGVLPKAATTMILGAALGGVLSVITGHPEIGMAGILGAQNIATSQFTAYSRMQERTADDYAVRLMKKLNWPLSGFRNATETMLNLTKERGFKDVPIYLQTHPASIERREYVDQFMAVSYKGAMSGDYQYAFKMAKARCAAFTQGSDEIVGLYPDQTKPEAIYAKALTLGISGQYSEALRLMSELIAKYPTDPYLLFARSEIYQATGLGDKALTDINAAINMAERSSNTGRKEVIMRFERATIYVILKQGKNALKEMSFIDQLDADLRRCPSFWDQYSRVYDLSGNKVMVSYALAEANLAVKNLNGVERYLNAGKADAKQGSIEWMKLKDLELRLEQIRAHPSAN